MKTFWTKAVCCGVGALLSMALVGCASTGSSEEFRTQSDMTDVQKRAAIRLQLAAGYYEQRQWPVALDEIKKVLTIDPNNGDAYNIRAMIYVQMNEMALAEDNFLRALSIMPNNPELANNYGWFLCQKGDVEKSIFHFEKAINSRAYASPATALNNAAVCSIKLKNDKAAEDYLNRAFRVDAVNPHTNANLAKLHYKRGEYDRAHFYMNRVTNIDALTADMLWTAIKIERKRKDRSAESVYISHLRRLHPNSPEFSAYQRGMFDE